MELKQRRYSVLIVSAQPKFNESLTSLIADRGCYDCDLETGVGSAKRRLSDREYDIMLINAPLPDDNGVRLAIDRSSGSRCAVLLLVRSEYYAEILEQVSPHGVYILPKPPSRQLVSLALDWLESTCERLKRLEKRSVSLEDKMAEIRLVNRAKWVLITSQGMTEEQAHKHIERLAMDRCVTKRVIAEEIIGN